MSANHHHESEHPGAQPDADLSRRATRALAIRDLLIRKGIVQADEIDEQVHRVRSRAPADGAKVVARTWVDPEFKARLLADARSAVAELGYTLTHGRACRRRKYRRRALPRRLYPLFVLPDRPARPATRLV